MRRNCRRRRNWRWLRNQRRRTTSLREIVPQRNEREGKRGGYATTNQLERGAGQENGGATREGWRNRVAEDAVTREEVVIQPPQTWFGWYLSCHFGLS